MCSPMRWSQPSRYGGGKTELEIWAPACEWKALRTEVIPSWLDGAFKGFASCSQPGTRNLLIEGRLGESRRSTQTAQAFGVRRPDAAWVVFGVDFRTGRSSKAASGVRITKTCGHTKITVS